MIEEPLRKIAKTWSNFLGSSTDIALPGRTASCPYLIPVKKTKDDKKKAFRLAEGLARAVGLEPAISGVTGQRDNQLRYARVMSVILHESEICVNKLHHKKSKKNPIFFKTDYAK